MTEEEKGLIDILKEVAEKGSVGRAEEYVKKLAQAGSTYEEYEEPAAKAVEEVGPLAVDLMGRLSQSKEPMIVSPDLVVRATAALASVWIAFRLKQLGDIKDEETENAD